MQESGEHIKFTGPARLSRSIHILEGLILGVTIDAKINDSELLALTNWVTEHEEFADRHPFDQFIPVLAGVVGDRSMSDEDRADVLWACGKFRDDGTYYSGVTADMQRLQGLLAGILADGQVTESEVRNLADWIEDHHHLQTVWPYAEIDAVITAVLADGIVSADEQTMLLDFFTEFSGLETRPTNPTDRVSTEPIAGICACNPAIEVPTKTFCFTGKSERCNRETFSQFIEDSGGNALPRVTKDLNYLVVGAAGNPCWAYSCYGRKVEQAMQLRQRGNQVLIVHEFDLWDAIEDLA